MSTFTVSSRWAAVGSRDRVTGRRSPGSGGGGNAARTAPAPVCVGPVVQWLVVGPFLGVATALLFSRQLNLPDLPQLTGRGLLG